MKNIKTYMQFKNYYCIVQITDITIYNNKYTTVKCQLNK